MKKWQMVVVAILVAFLLVLMLKDLVIKVSVEKGVEMVTGLKLSIRSLNVGIFRTAVSIKGLKVFNPPQFKDRVMVDMPEIYVDYDLPAMFSGTVHLRTLRINLKEFVVVKNDKGQLNLNSLNVVKAKKEGVSPEAKSGGKTPNIQIDNFELKIDKAFYKDYSKPGAPSIREFNVNLNERYTNITNPYAVVSIIVVKALANTSISGLTNFDIGSLKGTVGDTLSSAKNITGMAKQVLGTTAQNAPATVKNASDTVEKAAGALGDMFGDITKSAAK